MAYDASAFGAWVGGDDWRAWVGVTKTSDTVTQCVLKVESWVWSQYGTTSGYSNIRGAVAYGNNAWQYGSATSISTNSWKKLYEKSFTITKTTSAQTVKCWALAEGISELSIMAGGRTLERQIGADQMNLYLNYFKHEVCTEGDNEPFGIVLGAEKDRLTVQYALEGINNQLFVSRYQLYLPDRDALSREVYRIIEAHAQA